MLPTILLITNNNNYKEPHKQENKIQNYLHYEEQFTIQSFFIIADQNLVEFMMSSPG